MKYIGLILLLVLGSTYAFADQLTALKSKVGGDLAILKDGPVTCVVYYANMYSTSISCTGNIQNIDLQKTRDRVFTMATGSIARQIIDGRICYIVHAPAYGGGISCLNN